jgi:hypothetical protein
MVEEISVILQGMHILRLIYHSFGADTQPTRQQIVTIFTEALEGNLKLQEEQGARGRKRKFSTLVRSSSRASEAKTAVADPFEVKEPENASTVEFTLARILEGRPRIKSSSMKELLNLLQLISERGEKICTFLSDILILNSPEE